MTVGRRRPGYGWILGLLAAVGLLVGCGDPAPPQVTFAPLQHPFVGATLAVDPDTQAAAWQQEHHADWLDPITKKPNARWLNGFDDVARLPAVLDRDRQQHALPVLVAYHIPNRGCSGNREGAPYGDYDRPQPRPDSYAAWITALVQQLNGVHAVIVLEPDAVASDCFDAARAAVIRGAVGQLTAAGQYVYVDAGHASWVSADVMASRLLSAGIDRAEGVSLNVSNRYPTVGTADFGEQLSRLIGGRDYIIDSSRNGVESTSFDDLANDWCNRPQQALGLQETESPDKAKWPHFAARLWIKLPGESDGNSAVFPTQNCHEEPAPPGVFSPRQARQLILNDPRQPTKVLDRVRAVPDSGL